MEMVREYRIKENVGVKLYSDIEMYKKIFFANLHYRYKRAERNRKKGTLLEFDEVFTKLNKKYGVTLEL